MENKSLFTVYKREKQRDSQQIYLYVCKTELKSIQYNFTCIKSFTLEQ